MRRLIKFLSNLVMVAIVAMPIAAAAATPDVVQMGEIGDWGVWMTEENTNMFNATVTHDIEQFRPKQLVADYVPIEAKVGLAFMNGLTYIGDILDMSLVRFATIFIIVMFLMWTTAQGYKMMTKGEDARALVEDIIKKVLLLLIWLAVLNMGPAKLFMWVMAPILGVSTYLSDLILNAVANAAGANLPDTCAAIREYAAAHTAPNMLIDAASAADMMCVPTRMSGFFYTAVAAGWQWMLYGVGHSMFTFIAGMIFVVIFIYNIWKFALMAFGVIADLFLAIFMLPFTAVAETVNKTNYDGIAGQIYNGIAGIFSTQSLETQIQRFVNAALYFISLSIVVAVCTAILSGSFDTNLAAANPNIDTSGFMVTLLTGALVAYLASRADEIAKDIGGTIDAKFGDQVGKDIKQLAQNTYSTATKWAKIIRGKK